MRRGEICMQSGHRVVEAGWGLDCCTQYGEHEIGLMQQDRLVVLHADPCLDKVMANAYADSNSNSSERIREPPPLGLHPGKAEVTAAVPAALTSAHLPGGHPSADPASRLTAARHTPGSRL
jgi:hypothetical protein